MELDPASLEAIAQAARSCFLYEDAPDYLTLLEQGLEQLRNSKLPNAPIVDYASFIRAAHSLKGGAGIASLPNLMNLAHQLEDLLIALQEGQVTQWEFAHELVDLSIQEIKDQITAASNDQPETNPSVINEALEHFLESLSANSSPHLLGKSVGAADFSLVETALNVDLEECLQRFEELLYSAGDTNNTISLRQALANLSEECLLLGQALSLDWLTKAAESIKQALHQAQRPVTEIAKTAFTQIHQLRFQFLQQKAESLSAPSPQSPTPPVTTREPPQPSSFSPPPPALNLRIPVEKLDRMSDTVTDLLISYERLLLYQQQLLFSNQNLGKRTQQLDPIREQVQTFYDQLSFPTKLPGKMELSNFDPLHLDEDTEIHRTLQSFQELMVQVQETKSDFDVIARELQSVLDQVRGSLGLLHRDLNESRLVPFSFVAERFFQLLQELNYRYRKNVQLSVEGKQTLIDQVIVEQLQTPLTQLIRNAFDHGIEPPGERLALGKSEMGRIVLTATVEGNQAVVTVEDDGRGIDTQKVYHRAVQLGLYNPKSGDSLSHQQILEFLFQPSFSTAAIVSSLSGRGMGLDIVRVVMRRLRGSVRVESILGKGTKFTMSVPLTLNILPLLLCRCHQRTLAIPSANIREIIALSETRDSKSAQNWTQGTLIPWQEQTLPVFSLLQLLPYSNQSATTPGDTKINYPIGIVLDVSGQLVVVAVDDLLAERELVVKPFEPTILAPPYLAGCTVLGTGEVVPVLSPMHMETLIANFKPTPPVSQPQEEPSIFDPHYKTILIVDDSIAVRRSLSWLLSRVGYQVVQCRDGREALVELNRSDSSFDLVISDIEMPSFDGFTLLREVRKHPSWQNLPFALLTSRASEQHRQKAKSLGATAYFTKPFQPVELLNAIRSLLQEFRSSGVNHQ